MKLLETPPPLIFSTGQRVRLRLADKKTWVDGIVRFASGNGASLCATVEEGLPVTACGLHPGWGCQAALLVWMARHERWEEVVTGAHFIVEGRE